MGTEDPGRDRLARTVESMLRLDRDGDRDDAFVIWTTLEQRDQHFVLLGLLKMVNHLRAEREAETRLRHERVRAVVGDEVRVQFTLDSSADEILDRQAAAFDQKLTIPCNERGARSGG